MINWCYYNYNYMPLANNTVWLLSVRIPKDGKKLHLWCANLILSQGCSEVSGTCHHFRASQSAQAKWTFRFCGLPQLISIKANARNGTRLWLVNRNRIKNMFASSNVNMKNWFSQGILSHYCWCRLVPRDWKIISLTRNHFPIVYLLLDFHCCLVLHTSMGENPSGFIRLTLRTFTF